MTDPLAALRSAIDRVPGYLDAATCGLPPRATADAMRAGIDAWQAGRIDMAAYDEAVARSRAAYARVVGVDVADVAVGAQASSLVGLVAAAVPDGGEVVVVEGDFASVVFPFVAHADRGVTVRHVPLEALASQVRPGTAVVAFSLVQSRDGRVADADAVVAAARAAGALTLCDVTQAAGWYPVDAGRFDVTVGAAYKWLAGPRGAAFLTAGPAARERLRPLHAGWYAGAEVWRSIYGPTMRLADDARRFDVSPAWLVWLGTAPAVEAFAGVDPRLVHDHDVALADAFRAGVGLPPGGSAIVSLPDDEAGTLRAALTSAGCRVAGRGGGVRLAFHVWNDDEDVERAARAVREARGAAGARA
ncbi:aminotransferase class V-fold PLP-dependent enzyme [Cellulomonas fimi]|uniref:Aminotransferase class V n=1 Tax=Cellulomonas fimi (strain ATCC 484 / DSM 20113 / JCM 1341 / CCUG 24087 / LMG 16345 / NBRC 15513 / NCIMB 8980 / NCTC 7547 / NRS-133) TaxID=590998 RepID=F4H1Q7_CELFA|nr:aminotransferase class V-fold PLP-dependent enzyme [Cellulomonas fimi]AEE47477.1 aminotransferase class V [Cellulomonas fimi ATCC 484]NNH05546.1 aminotransferase class V-fold PLP-dependent enzyme [Cellulomonas fimi]VEH36324.1 Isopenicillin N epimerase [Cellulomonas fimi]